MTRFAMYETVKKHLQKDGQTMPFYQKVLLAGVSGATGGFVGTPADMVNVRWGTVRNHFRIKPGVQSVLMFHHLLFVLLEVYILDWNCAIEVLWFWRLCQRSNNFGISLLCIIWWTLTLGAIMVCFVLILTFTSVRRILFESKFISSLLKAMCVCMCVILMSFSKSE